MEKPGQRDQIPQIIYDRKLKSPLRYLVEGSITLFLWAVWAYWILPIATLIVWILGVEIYYESIVQNATSVELLNILKNGLTVVIIILTAKYIWMAYNYYIIYKRNKHRRVIASVCPIETMAVIGKLDAAQIQNIYSKNIVRIELKDNKIQLHL